MVSTLIRRGNWIDHGYSLIGPGQLTWQGWLWGGLLVGGPSAAVGDLAAACLLGLIHERPDTISIWAPVGLVSRPPWRFRRGLRAGYGEPTRTGVIDTVLDCWNARVPQRQKIVDEALYRRRITPEFLLAEMNERGRLADRRALQELLLASRAGAHSPLERLYLRDVERAHGLPKGARQVAVRLNERVDVLYDGLIVELDGRAGHEGAGAFRDMERDNAHLLAGLATLRFGWRDVRQRPCQVAQQVVVVLQRAGWQGEMRRCKRCRAR